MRKAGQGYRKITNFSQTQVDLYRLLTCNDDDCRQDNAKVEVIVGRLFNRAGLDGVGNEAENGANPEQQGETTEEVFAELDPLRGGFWRGECVGPVAFQVFLGFRMTKTLRTTNTLFDATII